MSYYLGREEEAALRRYALQNGCSRSYVVRVALRLFLGLPVPSAVRDELLKRLAAD